MSVGALGVGPAQALRERSGGPARRDSRAEQQWAPSIPQAGAVLSSPRGLLSWSRRVAHGVCCAGLLDYNVSVFKSALTSVFDMSRKSVPALAASVGSPIGHGK